MYISFRNADGDTRKQLLARAKLILTRQESNWTTSQKWRADIIFEFCPELKNANHLIIELISIYNAKSHKDAARLNLAKWCDRASKLAENQLQTIIDTFINHYDTMFNFFVNRKTNARVNHLMLK